ncbi:MAG TPA: carboxypeptidase regulatory-like domain-containing protein [Gemmatimonadaceae bacterium]|nr:carboxypeptidase regulatory-like domain-containing protein [Gemmatimonadaceae bacterium]
MLARLSLACVLICTPAVVGAQESSLPHLAVVGEVYDSVANRPLANAVVQIVRTNALQVGRTATTDARGRYRVDSIMPGEYFVTFFHPVVDSLGVQAPVRRVTLGARDPERVELGLPGTERVIAALCPGLPPFDTSAVIVGEIRDADTGMPIPNVTVAAQWVDLVVADRFTVERQIAQTRTGTTGSYALCGLPSGGEISLEARSDGRATGQLEVPLGARAIVRRDLALGEGSTFVTLAGEVTEGRARMDTLLRGPARLRGTVLNESGRPVTDAIVEVWRTGLTTRTDTAGKFEIASLPVGTHALEVRRIGFAPQQMPVHLASRAPTSVNVVLDKPVRMLDAVRVSARTLYSRRQVEIEQRRRRGFGHFIMRDELERSASLRVTDVLRRVPGVRVHVSQGGDVVTFARGQSVSGPCRPTVYLDGHRLGSGEDIDFLATVNSLEAIEVYTSASQAPAEYWGGGCGAIVLWTRVEPRLPKLPKPKKGSGKP